MTTRTYLSRRSDYLGDLGAKLRDLQGYRTLAHELIQNADDSRDATSMAFDVREDALIVDNDGFFSDCGQIEKRECPWKPGPATGHRCDFHRFRIIASGDKRGESGTTGAFGIGFITVYQVTDGPEIISAGRHWILHEDRDERERIEVCYGCQECTKQDLPGTRIILPWANDPDSQLRSALRAEIVPAAGPARMLEELRQSLEISMLFLKRLRTIKIKQDGQLVRVFERLDDGDSLILSDGGPEKDLVWHIVKGDFSASADRLRSQHMGRIEEKRSSQVRLAIPESFLRDGLLCACLPTEQNVRLPFHINADFFPTNDRKSVIFGNDYQSQWNREAVRASAQAFGQALERLPSLLGHQRFLEVLWTIKEVADEAEKGRLEPILGEFWRAVEPHLRTAAIVYTTKGQWAIGSQTSLLSQKEEAGAIPILEGLGVDVVHEDLRPYQNLLRAVSVPLLDIERICVALVTHGLDRRRELNALPRCLGTNEARDVLWGEIARLLDRQPKTSKAKADDEYRLQQVALAPGQDGALWPCRGIYSADDATVALFESISPGIPFVSNKEAFAPLVSLCPQFDATAAIEALWRVGGNQLADWLNGHPLRLQPLFEWFANRRQEVLSNEETRKQLSALPIFPSSAQFRSMENLALPGDFDDPLGLTDLIDLTALGGRREFLRDLGMPELKFRTYASALLPKALTNPSLSADKRRAAVILLSSRAGELRDDEEALRALAATPLVECTDGQFRHAEKCYFDSSIVRDCLGDPAPFAVLPNGHDASVRELYSWIGVAEEPRLTDIVQMIQELTAQAYSSSVVPQVQKIIAHLGKRLETSKDPKRLMEGLMVLKELRWLPARGKADRWHRTDELYATYQAYLFESQAQFLDAPANIQNASAKFLEFLGVGAAPPVGLVVKHLVHCADHQRPVNTVVYQFLNDNLDDPAIGQLKGKKCLRLGDAYLAPSQVFWGEHPFGRYRWRISEELRRYSNLFNRLGVRDAPSHEDALNVLKEISSEFGAANVPLDDNTYAVVMTCWEMLGKAMIASSIRIEEIKGLKGVKCVPNVDLLLHPPEWMFFENRAGLAGKFEDFLTKNVIARPLGAGGALAEAGVRFLGSAVEIELLECTDPVDDSGMTERFRARYNEIARVLDSQGSSQPATDALSRLNDIRCETATSLLLRYRLNAFNRVLHSQPELVPALYLPDQTKLCFTRREGRIPWAAFARELAISLCPDEDPGRYAAGLKEVLSAETAMEAANVLDELGFPRLDTTHYEAPPAAEAAGTLGTNFHEDEPVQTSQPNSTDGTDDVGGFNVQDAINAILGSGSAPPTPSVESDVEPQGTGHQNGNNGRAPSTAATSTIVKEGRPVLRSYLPSPQVGDAGADGGGDTSEDSQHRSAVDQAGVRHVLEYETMCGRIPKEMPHTNPGYDIESRDATGQVVRYIEIKSFSGQWINTYAVLSRAQFEKATQVSDRFWLYVVERAESDDFKLHRIQNPARKANHFMFDDGWRAISEITDTSEKAD